MTHPASPVKVLDHPFDPEEEVRRFRQALTDAGALVSFTGIVRNDDETEALILSHYPGFTEKSIEAIAATARARFGLIAMMVLHRVGRMAPGEPVVLVAAAAAHRRAAFEGVDYLMDYLKSAAPFWKKEESASGAHWIEPSSQDHQDRKRWED